MEINDVQVHNFRWRSKVRCIAYLDLVQSIILIFVYLAFIILILLHKDGRFLFWALLLLGIFYSINFWSAISLLVDTTEGTDHSSSLSKVLLWRNVNIILVILIIILGILNWEHLKISIIGLGLVQIFFRTCIIYIVGAFIKELKRLGATYSAFHRPPEYCTTFPKDETIL